MRPRQSGGKNKPAVLWLCSAEASARSDWDSRGASRNLQQEAAVAISCYHSTREDMGGSGSSVVLVIELDDGCHYIVKDRTVSMDDDDKFIKDGVNDCSGRPSCQILIYRRKLRNIKPTRSALTTTYSRLILAWVFIDWAAILRSNNRPIASLAFVSLAKYTLVIKHQMYTITRACHLFSLSPLA